MHRIPCTTIFTPQVLSPAIRSHTKSSVSFCSVIKSLKHMESVIFIPARHVNKNKYNQVQEKLELTDQLEIKNQMMTYQISQGQEKIFAENIFAILIINYLKIQNIKMKQTTRVKILILGQSSVGKSSLLTQFVEQKFQVSHMPTIGVEYKQKLIELEDNSLLKVQIWDTAGTERFRTITPVYYRNVDGALLVFDITDAASFQTINYWVQELNDKADIASIQLMLVGNKIDLEQSRLVSKIKAEEVAKKIGISYCQTSAKNYQTTQVAFNELIDRILVRKKKGVVGGVGKNLKLTQGTNNKKEKKEKQCC